MPGSEELFHQIVKEVPGAIEGKMFGASCIKSKNGKAAAIFWKDNVLFKLPEDLLTKALQHDGVKIGTHLYDSCQKHLLG